MSGPLSVSVDLGHPIPPYEQIRSQISAHLSAGALRPGDRLPTVRALAADLGVAVGTVSRAYRELEQEGAVTSRRRTGTVVSSGAPGTADRPAPAAATRAPGSGPAPGAAGAAGAPAARSTTPGPTSPVDPVGPVDPTSVTASGGPARRARPTAGGRSGGREPQPETAGGPGGDLAGDRGAAAAAPGGIAGLVAAADALAAAAVRAGVDDRELLTLVSGALLLARRP